MKRFLPLLFALALFPAVPTSAQETDVLTSFRQETSDFREAYKKIVKEDISVRKGLKNQQERIRSKYEIDDNDSDSERKRKRDQKQRELQQNREKKKEIDKRIDVLRDRVNLYEVYAVNLQNKLKETEIDSLYHFDYYGAEIRLAFKGSKIQTDYTQDSSFKINNSSDPHIILYLIDFEINQLDAAGCDFSQETDAVPALYANFRLFFRYFQNLEICQAMEAGFKHRSSNDYTLQRELHWRLKALEKDAARLSQLLSANNRPLAKKLNLVQFTEDFIRFIKNNVGKRTEFGGKILNGKKNDDNKDLKKKTFEATHLETLSVLRAVAKDVRVADISSVSPTKRKKSKGKAKSAKAKVFANEHTPFFAMEPGKVPKEMLAAKTDSKLLTDAVDRSVLENDGSVPEKRKNALDGNDLANFDKEREAFRKEFANTDNLLSDGLDEQAVTALKVTLTPAQIKKFDEIVQRKTAQGVAAYTAAAQAYIVIRTAEKSKPEQMNSETVETIRDRMEQYRDRKKFVAPTPTPEEAPSDEDATPTDDEEDDDVTWE